MPPVTKMCGQVVQIVSARNLTAKDDNGARPDMCVDVCADVCVDVCADLFAGMSGGVFVGMRECICVGMHWAHC